MKQNEDVPQYIIETLAKMILPEIQQFYESCEGKAFFEEYKAEKYNRDEH